MQAVLQPRVDILGTPIDNMTMQQTLNLIEDAIEKNQRVSHTVVNAGKIVLMHQNAQLKQSVVNADIINADGQGVVWASRILGQPIVERVTGIDLMDNLVKLAYQKKYKIFFFGAKDDVLNKVITHYSDKYSPDIVAGAGGDGTINYLAGILKGSGIPLLIVPLGSANGMAKEL